jgi:hypothetical protein
MSSEPKTLANPQKSDLATVVVVSAFAAVAATAVHELGGHGLASVVLGKLPKELGAYYVDTVYAGLPDLAIRAIALAGPIMSLVLGLVAFAVLALVKPRGLVSWYFGWLVGALGLMTAAGYLLFSGASGIGDFGMTRDGVFFGAEPQAVVRAALVVVGAVSYFLVVRWGARVFDRKFGGRGVAGIRQARQLAFTSYFSAAAVSVAIGLLNPHGLEIVLSSAVASSLGAGSGLLWVMQFLSRGERPPASEIALPRSFRWLGCAALGLALYAIVLGPGIRL